MGFTLRFLILFFNMLFQALPILLFLGGVIFLCARKVQRYEQWTRFDTIYFAFVTATTVGYGDFRPQRRRSRVLSIIIALTGLVMTGIMVALAMQAVTLAYKFTQEGLTLGEVIEKITTFVK